MINIQKMMKQAQQMQFKMQELQEKLKDMQVQAEAGGGLIKITMSGDGRVKALDIEASTLEDKETLEDLVIAAVNNATDAKEILVQDETKRLMEESGIPSDTKLPF